MRHDANPNFQQGGEIWTIINDFIHFFYLALCACGKKHIVKLWYCNLLPKCFPYCNTVLVTENKAQSQVS